MEFDIEGGFTILIRGSKTARPEVWGASTIKEQQYSPVNRYFCIFSVSSKIIKFIGDAMGADGTHYFRIRHTSCAIECDDFVPKRLPEDMRQRMLDYQRDCGDG